MLLHVIWGFVDDSAHECPTFSVTGVMLQWADGSPAHVRQGRFQWRDDAWQAAVEVTRAGSTTPFVSGVMRLSPDVSRRWMRRSINARSEASRQLCEAMQTRGWTSDLGIITLKS